MDRAYEYMKILEYPPPRGLPVGPADGEMQVVFSKMFDEFEWLSLEACIVGIGLLSFSSIRFIVVLCLLKKTYTNAVTTHTTEEMKALSFLPNTTKNLLFILQTSKLALLGVITSTDRCQ